MAPRVKELVSLESYQELHGRLEKAETLIENLDKENDLLRKRLSSAYANDYKSGEK
jgi:hypothetical protein